MASFPDLVFWKSTVIIFAFLGSHDSIGHCQLIELSRV